jgi:hypothetical protein
LAGPFRADAAAQRMGSVVMQAPRPAGGVAHLCAMPFAAGQPPAVRRQPPAIDRDSCIAFTGAQPDANWQRACPPVHYPNFVAAIRRQGS